MVSTLSYFITFHYNTCVGKHANISIRKSEDNLYYESQFFVITQIKLRSLGMVAIEPSFSAHDTYFFFPLQ